MMLWTLLAAAGLFVVALAARSVRFRHMAEPALSVLVAVVLVSAFVVWWTDDRDTPQDQVSPMDADQPAAAILPKDIRLDDLVFVSGTPAGSYTVTGTIHNDGAAFLDYFTLEATLDDCPDAACGTVGSDEALILARIPPGRSAPLRTALVFPERRAGPPVAPHWTTAIRNIRALPAGR